MDMESEAIVSIPLLKSASRDSLEGSGLHSNYGGMTDDPAISSDMDEKIKSDSKWYIFDNLLCNQAEDLLHHHGNHGTYLVSHFHDTDTYALSVRLSSDAEEVTYKHYAINTNRGKFTAEGLPGTYSDIEGVVEAVKHRLSISLLPIFHKQRVATLSRSVAFEITLNEDDKPPEYTRASKYPEAAKKPLPLIVPVYPTLRRMMRAEKQAAAAAAQNSEEASAGDSAPRGCCWKAFHTDVNGKWYKPHKAGPVMACGLVVGWILFLVFFGWVVGLALLLVLLLTLCACFINFLCTGKCQVEEDSEEQQQQETEGEAISGNHGNTPQNYEGTANTPQNHEGTA